MSKELKPVLYNLFRRGWYGQAASLCEAAMAKKGKEPVSLYWHAVALGLQGQLSAAIRELEAFSARRDLHYAMNVALLYFHRRARSADRETVNSLKAELSVSEDVTKEAGLVLAARFLLYTNQFSEARRIAEKFEGNGLSASMSVFELESFLISHWSTVEEMCATWDEDSSDQKAQLSTIADAFRINSKACRDLQDADALALYARVSFLLTGCEGEEVHAVLNQCVSLYPPSVYPYALSDKALLCATAGEWEQALEIAQRVADVDSENLDVLLIFAVHALTQESSPHEAVQKMDDLDRAIQAREPNCWTFSLDCAQLLSVVCGRQPRILEMCARMLERSLTQRGVALAQEKSQKEGPSGSFAMAPNPEEEAILLCALGHVCIMQNTAASLERATRVFRDAQRRDPQNIAVVLGLVLSLVIEGSVEDAQTHMELLSLSHSDLDQLGHECAFVRALILMKSANYPGKEVAVYGALDRARDLYVRAVRERGRAVCVSLSEALLYGAAPRTPHLNAFALHRTSSPDFALSLSLALFSLTEYRNRVILIPSTASLLSGNSQFSAADAATAGEPADQSEASNVIGNARHDSTLLLNSMSSLVMGNTVGGASDAQTNAEGELDAPTQSGLSLLYSVQQLCPHLLVLYLERARALLTHGRTDESVRVLSAAVSLNTHSVVLYLALAHAEVVRGGMAAAARLLEQALSVDFSVRNANKFRLIKAVVCAQQGKFAESLTELESILSQSEFNFSLAADARTLKAQIQSQTPSNPQTSLSSQITSQDPLRLTEDDRVQVYISYACVLARQRRTHDAKKALQLSKVVWTGTPQEVQVLEAGASLYCEKQDYDAAVRLLDSIPPESSSFQRAQTLKADILLTHMHDKEAFIRCFLALSQAMPESPIRLALLGEAYLRVLNPDRAIEALHRAFDLDPHNGPLRAKIGRALIATHEYMRAVDFYETALRSLSRGITSQSQKQSPADTQLERVSLSHDLARLYLKLHRVESAVRLLRDALSQNTTTASQSPHTPHNARTQDVVALQHDVRTLLLLAKVQEKGSSPVDGIDSLEDALHTQREILAIMKTSSALAAQVADERLVLSDILTRLGAAYLSAARLSESERALQDALSQDAHNVVAMVCMARVHAEKKELPLCLSLCQRVLTATATQNTHTRTASLTHTHRDAAILCSETILRMIDNTHNERSNTKNADLSDEQEEQGMDAQVNFTTACEPLTNYMRRYPNDYLALSHTISALRRAGKLREIEEFLNNARTADARATSHPGYHYCSGLYARFTNDSGKAIFEFNYARKDAFWGEAALTHMVELYLNPDNEGVWEEVQGGANNGADEEVQRGRVTAAEQLLRELGPIASDERRVRVLECYTMLAHRTKIQTDRAMQAFAEMLDNDQDYLPAVLGMATGFMIEKNQHKARNLLKRVAKLDRHAHDGEDFEKAHLLLAKFYIDKGKSDQAQEVCRRVLWVNKSCAQAWELLALVFEKDAQYELAADAYQKAWELEFEASATVGFKLAFSLLKCRRLVECVDVCESVLRQYPDYPRISEEILNKALLSLRTNAAA